MSKSTSEMLCTALIFCFIVDSVKLLRRNTFIIYFALFFCTDARRFGFYYFRCNSAMQSPSSASESQWYPISGIVLHLCGYTLPSYIRAGRWTSYCRWYYVGTIWPLHTESVLQLPRPSREGNCKWRSNLQRLVSLDEEGKNKTEVDLRSKIIMQ